MIYNWASTALTYGYTSTQPCDVDRICSAIRAAWLQEHRRTDVQSINNQNKSQCLFWKFQHPYGNPYSFRKTSFKQNFNKENSKIHCWDCGERGRLSTDCPKPRKMT